MEFKKKDLILCIKDIRIDGRKLFHVSIRPPMSDKQYDALKYRLERMGGHWRERFGGFIFVENPIEKFKDEENWKPLVNSEWDEWRISRQFYPTPQHIAEDMVELANIKAEDSILEPSAGRGALMNSIPDKSRITLVEIDSKNCEILKSKGYAPMQSSFEDAIQSLGKYKKILMNPPFSGQRDIKHIMLAYELLEQGGTLVAVMAENDLFYRTDLTVLFNEFLKNTNAQVMPVPFRSFAETTVDTVIVKIQK